MKFGIVRSIRALHAAIARHRSGPLNSSASLALVPTMGAIHEAHEKLIDEAKKHADIVIASIFVNPKQFSQNEDFDNYPKSEEQDIEKLKSKGCNIVFIPNIDLMYPKDFDLNISVPKLSSVLCGKSRPHHFEGVATVVTKLLLLSNADYAIFGEKDFQQLLIIKSLVKSLNIPCEIISIKTVRENNGLAISSRNTYLSEKNKKIAREINISLKDAIKNYKNKNSVSEIIHYIKEQFLIKGIKNIDYIEIRDETNLNALNNSIQNARIFIAVYIDNVRLIDNMKLIID